VESFWLDVRYAIRSQAASRGVAGLSILCLGLGIGVATMVFAVVNAVLLRPLPLRQPQRILSVSEAPKTTPDVTGPVPGRIFHNWQAQRLSAEFAATRTVSVVVSGVGDRETFDGAAMSSNLFAVLGVDPVIGRAFRPEEDRPGSEGVILLSERLWRSRFAADPRVLGSALVVSGQSRTIVGVVPRFDHPALPASWRNAQVWLPLGWDSRVTNLDDTTLSVLARAPEGIDPAAAAARLETEAQAVNNGANNGDRLVRVRPLDLSLSPTTRAMILTAMGAAIFVLLIACTNVANLLLLKAVARQREVATMMALGASRARIIRQLFLESAALGVAGVPGGLLVGRFGRDLLLAGSVDQQNVTVPIDATVVAVSIGTALLTTLVFGFAPAVNLLRGSIPQVLADGARQATGGRAHNRLRLAFATGAVALSVVLSASASLLARSFGNLVAADRTVDLSPLLMVGLGSPADRDESADETARLTQDILARLRSLPGVASVAVSDFTPLRGAGARVSVVLEGIGTQPSAVMVRRNGVTAGFFGTLGISFDVGRPFTAAEERSGLPVAVVNRRMANQLWPGETAIGKQFRFVNDTPSRSYTVIGVSNNTSNWDVGNRPLPTAYVPLPEASEGKRAVMVRATGDPRRLIQPVREIVASVDSTPRRPQPVLMEAVIRDAFSRQKTLALLFSAFSLLSLVLTAVGLYSVLSYFVSQQRRELGIRAALGAGRRDLMRLVAAQGLSMAAGGLAIGLVGAYAAMRVLRGLLYEVSTTDPLSVKVSVLVVVVVTLAASWLPAHRAASVDPARCLRDA